MKPIRVTIWNENIDETNQVAEVLQVHPQGIHHTLRELVEELGNAVEVRTATLQEDQLGLTDQVLENTDVLLWWSHKGHDQVPDEIVGKVRHRVHAGMGLILLHSSHYSKLLKSLLGTTGDLKWKHDAYERLFCVCPTHPIARGVPEVIELGVDECYTEYFDIPAPEDLIFIGWFDHGNVFRSGCTWTRGNGKIFYFQPGHETNRAYYNPHVRRILQNAVEWACPYSYRQVFGAPKVEETLEEIRRRNGDC